MDAGGGIQVLATENRTPQDHAVNERRLSPRDDRPRLSDEEWHRIQSIARSEPIAKPWHLKRLIALNLPDAAVLVHWRGGVHETLGEWGLMLADYRKAIDLGIEGPVFSEPGDRQANQGNWDKAFEAYCLAVQHGEGARAFKGLGSVHDARGEVKEAIIAIKKAVGLGLERLAIGLRTLRG